jgi:hypothetical protein
LPAVAVEKDARFLVPGRYLVYGYFFAEYATSIFEVPALLGSSQTLIVVIVVTTLTKRLLLLDVLDLTAVVGVLLFVVPCMADLAFVHGDCFRHR